MIQFFVNVCYFDMLMEKNLFFQKSPTSSKAVNSLNAATSFVFTRIDTNPNPSV